MNGEDPVFAVLEAVKRTVVLGWTYPHASSAVCEHTVTSVVREPPGPWMVAVSGGVDSMVLLHAVKHVTNGLGIDIEAVHVDHGMRPTSGRDREFVGHICAQWGIPLTVRKLDWQNAKPWLDTYGEAAARDLRYQAFIQVVRQRRARGVLLAHHADDQVETVLLRFLRGASLSGLAGIRARVKRGGVWWIRPFLTLNKEILQSYSKQFNIPYVEDESNQDDRYLRNFLRLKVTPLLRERQPRLARIVARNAELIQEDDAYLDELARAHLPTPSLEDGSYRLSRQKFLRIPVPLQRRAIKIILYCLASADWTAHHVQAVLDLARDGGPSDGLDLPQRVEARCEYDVLIIGLRSMTTGDGPVEIEWPLGAGQMLVWPGGSHVLWEFTCFAWVPEDGFHRSLYEMVIPSLSLLRIAPTQTHWRVRPMGLNGSRKLQDVMVDKKIPRNQRSSWPSVWYGDELLWLPGLVRTRERLVSPDVRAGWLIRVRTVHPPGKPVDETVWGQR